MKVYVLTTGDYEDERVAGVFTSMEKLNEFKSKVKSTEGYIHKPFEIELDFIPEENQSVYRVINPDNNPITSNLEDIGMISRLDKVGGSKPYRWVYVLASSYFEANELGKKLFNEQENQK